MRRKALEVDQDDSDDGEDDDDDWSDDDQMIIQAKVFKADNQAVVAVVV